MANGANWFIALPVESPALETLTATLPAGLRRLHPDDWHLTLAFLGAVGEQRALAAWRRAGDIDAAPFAVEATGPAAFGRPSRPSAFGLDIERGHEALRALIEQWRDPLRAAAGVEPESRDARPHITLARPPRRGGRAIHERAAGWLRATRFDPVPLRLEQIALYTAAEPGMQRLFRRVAQRPLGDPGT